MKALVDKLLAQKAPLKAREIARELGLDKSELNAFLHNNSKYYKKDGEFRWCLANQNIFELILPAGWVDSEAFETCLSNAGPIFDQSCSVVRIYFPAKCYVLFGATARLLALANQLVWNGKDVTLDFTDAESTLTYADRSGFLDLIDEKVAVLPSRPIGSAAIRYGGQSETLVEFGTVDPNSSNEILIETLAKKFVQQTSSLYETVAITVFGELISNVREHSGSSLHGFAGLQKYGGRQPHIQTVVSDSGLGISHTLRPALCAHYPNLYRLFGNESRESDIGLVKEVMSKGQISRFGGARGLGFKSSGEQAKKFNATFSVRQEKFCLKFEYRNGKLENVHTQDNLSKLLGTHICFDFYLV